MKMKCTLFVVLLSWVAKAEIFTSIGQMTDLIYAEKELVQSLKEYVKAEESKIEMIKSWATKLDTLMHVSTSDPEGYLSHPVNAYKLVKRLKVEWLELVNLVLLNLSGGFISNISLYWPYFPSDEDARGVAKALIRLQDTYRLDPESFSKGKLPGVQDGALLTVDDCFDMGQTAYNEADHYHSMLWLQQALRQLDAGEMARVTKSNLLDFLSYSAYQMGDFPRAIEIIKRLVMIDPGHPNAKANLRYVEDLLAKGLQADQATSQDPAMAVPVQFGPYDRLHYHLPAVGVYEALCRGEGINMTPRRWSRLFCRYHNGNGNPFLLLAPVKEEDEWDSPRIVRYLDFLSDEEMEKIKGMARPRLSRAGVLDTKLGLGVAVDARVSKSAWLGDWEDPVVARVTRRMEDVTGLTGTTAELLQVVNYGVGGQYEPHFDFARNDEPKAFLNLGTGNRVATFLNYMSDVAAGGATVFPSVRAAIWPRKGTAVFWYNLFRSGEGDYRTLHAACPVLVGSKWVSNKWFHEKSQEFRRPCGLTALD